MLTDSEWRALSLGLAKALRASGAEPRLQDRAHPGARLSALWRGAVPLLTRGDVIWWPDAPADLAAAGYERAMAVLQHELQHVLDYRTGRLTAARYLLDSREWLYAYDLADGRAFGERGAEQRATMAEHLWLAEHALGPGLDLERLRRDIPWAV